MSYMVMWNGAMRLRTNVLADARAELKRLGDTAYIKYSNQGVKRYEATHSPHKGDKE